MKFILAVLVVLLTLTAYADSFEFIKTHEGFAATSYKDNTQSSIGYGLSVTWAKAHGYRGGTITVEEAERLLQLRINEDYGKLCKLLPGFSNYPKSVQTAIQDSYYNCPAVIGPRVKRFCQSKDWRSLVYELGYNYNPGKYIGLVRRHIDAANLIAEELGFPKLEYPTSLQKHQELKSWWLKQI